MGIAVPGDFRPMIRLIPPAGQCATCGKPLAIGAARSQMTVATFHEGKLLGDEWVIHACSAKHMAEAMHRLAYVIEQKDLAQTANSDTARQAGLTVRERRPK